MGRERRTKAGRRAKKTNEGRNHSVKAGLRLCQCGNKRFHELLKSISTL